MGCGLRVTGKTAAICGLARTPPRGAAVLRSLF